MRRRNMKIARIERHFPLRDARRQTNRIDDEGGDRNLPLIVQPRHAAGGPMNRLDVMALGKPRNLMKARMCRRACKSGAKRKSGNGTRIPHGKAKTFSGWVRHTRINQRLISQFAILKMNPRAQRFVNACRLSPVARLHSIPRWRVNAGQRRVGRLARGHER